MILPSYPKKEESKNNDQSALSQLIEYRKAIKTYDSQAGPANPKEKVSSLSSTQKNLLTGRVEKQIFDATTFNENYQNFKSLGYTVDPTINPDSSTGQYAETTENGLVINDMKSYVKNNGRTISQLLASENSSSSEQKINFKERAKRIKTERSKKGDASKLEGNQAYKGPWASYNESSSSTSEEEEEEPEEYEQEEQEQQQEQQPTKKEKEQPKEWSEFVGSQEYDYLGRTYMHVPQDLDVNLLKEPGSQECFIPKKRIHTWAGHSGGVNALRFFPNSGHLLLSCGNDMKIKLWDCHHSREHLRTFHGHTKAVKDVSFNNAGTQFLSASYDKSIKLWDTETGKVISRFNQSLGPGSRLGTATANCVRFNPEPDKQTSFLSAMSDRKILQWDTRTPNEIVQTYDHHLGPVNSITFVDNNQRFMTTSDDKSIRVWEWQINVPIKFIADPHQHAMPTVALHPKGKYVACQSMDNRILVFGATDRFRANRKKEFSGHLSAGYPIQVAFSPDGKYLMSGDANGYAYFWDWKTCSLKSKFKASLMSYEDKNSSSKKKDGGSTQGSVITCIAAHPQETSKVATAGKEAAISYWD